MIPIPSSFFQSNSILKVVGRRVYVAVSKLSSLKSLRFLCFVPPNTVASDPQALKPSKSNIPKDLLTLLKYTIFDAY